MNSTDTIASLRRARKPCLSETEDQKKQVESHFPYRNPSDDAGVARVSVPKGEYRLCVLEEDYKDFQATAAIASDAARDVAIRAELLFAPDLGG